MNQIDATDARLATHEEVCALRYEAIQKSFASRVVEPLALAPTEFATRVKSDIARWGQTARSLNYQATDG
jgi:tripartite-type tricarboxylate transporter receptor subunit TctC